LQFSIGGNTIGSVYTAPGVGVWSEFTATFVAGIEPIAVLDLNTAPNGNDFAVDDISIIAVPEPAMLALAGLSGLSLLLFRRQRK
jgi:cobalamin biosynthesis protein CbiG